MQEGIAFLSLLFLLFLLGVPVAFALILSGIGFLAITEIRPLIVVPQRVFAGMNSFPLLAIPLFILMGFLMEKAGLSKRLIDLVDMIVGQVRGSLAIATVLACALFGTLTGSAPATVAAIGGIMMPAMLAQKYPAELATGVTAASGALGNIIPPSIALILYGATMNVSIPKLFIGNILPGALFMSAFVLVTLLLVRGRYPVPKVDKRRRTFGEAANITWRAMPALLLPVIILGGIYGGVFTPTEAAAIGVLLSFLLGVVYRNFTWRKILNILSSAVETSSMVCFILGGAGIFGWILASSGTASLLTSGVASMLDSQFLYLAILTVFLLLVGCVMDAGASIVILAPILVPIGVILGLDPIHLGVVFCTNLVVGFFTPPFGLNLFTAVSISGHPYMTVVRGVLPFVVAAVVVLFAIAYFPQISLFLVRSMS